MRKMQSQALSLSDECRRLAVGRSRPINLYRAIINLSYAAMYSEQEGCFPTKREELGTERFAEMTSKDRRSTVSETRNLVKEMANIGLDAAERKYRLLRGKLR